MIKLDLFWVHKDGFGILNQCDTPYQQQKRHKAHDHLSRYGEGI